MQKIILQCQGITKQYAGTKALDSVNIELRKGEIYGFIGANGAGKTTLLRIITGLIKPTSGTVSLFGKNDARGLENGRKRIGCLIEGPALYPSLSARDNLEYYRIQKGYPDQECVENALKIVNLTDTGKKKYKQFSLGMKQRLGMALAIMGKPDILILDEPINGLDPNGIFEFREMLKYLKNEWGMTILISSHILSELELVAERYGIIRNGQLLKELTHAELVENTRRYLSIKVENPAEAAAALEQALGIEDYEVYPANELRVYEFLNRSADILATLAANHIRVAALSEEGSSLEDYFMSITGQQEGR